MTENCNVTFAFSFRAFGAKPLEDVIKNLRAVIMSELENALAQHAPPIKVEDPTRHEMPPLVIDGIPTPVEKMTQAQLRAFIPLMLKYSTGMNICKIKTGLELENFLL